MTDAITLRCPAKVNLALSVGAPRGDGYHPIASWMAAVGLCDELELRKTTGESRYTIDWAADAPTPSPIDWPLDSDLIVKAHRLVERHVGRSLPVAATLGKRIPVGAGLAGGSSDGAAMLRGLNELFDLALDRATLVELAMQLGSDLAFFFTPGSSLVTGRGEGLENLPPAMNMHLTLVMPPFGCPTGAVYQAFDELRPDAAVDLASVRAAIAGEVDCFNDLADPACRVEPRLGDLRNRITEMTGRPTHITGSGAGLFLVARSAEDAVNLASVIADKLAVAARAVAVGATR